MIWGVGPEEIKKKIFEGARPGKKYGLFWILDGFLGYQKGGVR